MSRDLFVRFPPGRGNVFVPVEGRPDTLAGLSLYAGCRRHVLLGQRLAGFAVAAAGSRALPGARLEWRPPMPHEQWEDLLATWRGKLGAFERFALIVRRQHSRSGFGLLLLHAGSPVAFVKVRDDARPLTQEAQALTLLQDRPVKAMEAPAPLGLATSGELTWLATSPMTSRPHRPEPHAPIMAVLAEVQDRLSALPRPADTPPHWEPMHGDLTPWNLRWSTGRRWLLDWEDAGYGPPGADELYYRLTCASVGVPTVPATTPSDEAVHFWLSAVDERRESEADVVLSAFLANEVREHLRSDGDAL